MVTQQEQPLDVEEARAAGVPWADLISGRPVTPPSPRQVQEAGKFVRFRAGLGTDEDQRTVERGARILMSGPGRADGPENMGAAG